MQGYREYIYTVYSGEASARFRPLTGCPPLTNSSLTSKEVAVCLPDSLTAAWAISSLEAEFGAGWEANLWRLLSVDESTTEALAANLDPTEPGWDEWDTTLFAPSLSTTPRREVFLRALWLINETKAGIPATWVDRPVREKVIDPLLAGEMRYAIYGVTEDVSATTDGLLFVAVAEAVDVLIQAIKDLMDLPLMDVAALEDLYAQLKLIQFCGPNPFCWGASVPLLDIDAMLVDLGLILVGLALIPTVDFIFVIAFVAAIATVEAAVAGLQALLPEARLSDIEQWVVEKVIRPAMCNGPTFGGAVVLPETNNSTSSTGCGGTEAVDLRSGAIFVFPLLGAAADVGMGGNHGFMPERRKPDLPFGGRVWICSTELDLAAVAYDYLMGLAARHLAYATFWADAVSAYSGRTPGRASPFDSNTAHAHKVAARTCVQMALSVVADGIAAHMVHETTHNIDLWHCGSAVLQTQTECIQDGVAYSWWAHATATFGLARAYAFDDTGTSLGFHVDWSPQIRTHTTWSGSTPTRLDEPLGPYDQPYAASVKCVEEGKLTDDQIKAINLAANLLLLVDPNTGILTIWALQFLEEDLGPHTPLDALVVFTIDRPLQVGGKVLGCCFTKGPSACCEAEGHPCWETDPPNDVYDPECCVSTPSASGGTTVDTDTGTGAVDQGGVVIS